MLKEIASYQNSKECSGTEIGVQFKKKSGFDITRQYIVTAEQLGRLLEACYEQGTLKDNKYDILEKYRQKVSFITVDPLNELDDQYSVTFGKSDSQKLLESAETGYSRSLTAGTYRNPVWTDGALRYFLCRYG